jgi:glycosyltransferase involved in cell wall biosynthesis
MKILFLLHSYHKYNQGGAELQIKYIAEYLNEKGFDIHYLFLYKEEMDTVDNNIHLYSIKKSPLGEKLLGKFCYFNKVLDKLNHIKPDIVYHRNLSTFALPVVKYCKDNNCKSFLHLAHIQDVEDILKINKKVVANILDRYGKKEILTKFDKVIAQAQYQDTLLQENFNRKSDLILPNMHPYPEEEIVKDKKIKVLWIANFKAWKQPEKFIKLAKACTDVNAEFIMIGRDSNDDRSKRLKENISKLNNLKYLGELPIEEVNQYLATSHIFVNTSISEGFPNTFIQSWMREVPAVSLHVDPDDVMSLNNIGFHSKTLEQMVVDVKRLINDSKLRKDMGSDAKEYANKMYSLKNIDKIIELIK